MKETLLSQLPADLRSDFAQYIATLEIARQSAENAKQSAESENKLLREEIRLLRIEKFGPKSDQLSDSQLELLEGEPSVTVEEIETEARRTPAEKRELKPRKAHPGRKELPAHLPRVEKLIPCTEAECRCEQCGQEKKVIGFETSEELDVEPAKYFVRVNHREKRACPACPEMGVTTAALAPKIIEKAKAADSMVVDAVIKKYGDHLPLYRQSAILEREAGVELSRATLCGWVMKAGELLEAVTGAMRADLLGGKYIQADETPVGVHNQKAKGKNHQGYFWEYSRPGGPVLFDFQMGRSRKGPRRFLATFGGVLQTDGYAAYAKVGACDVIHAGCWAHVRREFVDALKVDPENETAQSVIASIGALYLVEKQAREQKLSHADRLLLRQQQGVAGKIAQLKAEIVEARKQVLPKSLLGKACDYALGQWPRLIIYAENGEVEIDNNWCENAIRPFAVGRKNWLHIGSEIAGPRVAAITSIFETCRRLGINIRDYLNDVLPRLPNWPINRVAELTPMVWAAARNLSG